MKALVTNDDGIDHGGLRILAAALDLAGHEVRVLAPDGDRSGAGASLGSITADDAFIPMRRRSIPGLDQIVAYSIDAPPALGVRAACKGAFGWLPDIVVSGVNPGHNTGRLVIHSGTVGAALTAASCDIAGLAVSAEDGSQTALAAAATLASWAVPLVARPDSASVAASINVPARSLDALQGVRTSALSDVSLVDVGFTIVDGGLRTHRTRNDGPFRSGSDAELLCAGYATISVLCGAWNSPTHPGDFAAQLDELLIRLR